MIKVLILSVLIASTQCAALAAVAGTNAVVASGTTTITNTYTGATGNTAQPFAASTYAWSRAANVYTFTGGNLNAADTGIGKNTAMGLGD